MITSGKNSDFKIIKRINCYSLGLCYDNYWTKDHISTLDIYTVAGWELPLPPIVKLMDWNFSVPTWQVLEQIVRAIGTGD